MTSKNSSSGKTFRRTGLSQIQILRRRLWPSALTLLLFLLYHVIGTVIMLNSRSESYTERILNGLLAPAPLGELLLDDAAGYLGGTAPGLVLAAAVGTILALQGYAWLSNRQAVDFYESQPISRLEHFRAVALNSLWIFAVCFVLTLGAGLLICACYSVPTGLLLPYTVQYVLRSLLVFWASFGLGTLAVMLTGNVIVSLLAECVFLLYELLAKALTLLLMDYFFDTFVTDSFPLERLWTSPIAYAYSTSLTRSLLGNGLLGGILLFLAWIAYSRRKNEQAGSAVLFAPVRTVVKIAVSLIGSLAIALLFIDIAGLKTGILCGILAALIIGCIMEIIYAYNFKALLHEPLSLLVPAVLVTAILLICKNDVLGYDTWIPSADQVKDAAVYSMNYNYPHYHADGTVYNSNREYYMDSMHLTDVDAVTALSGACIDEMMKKKSDAEGASSDFEITEQITVLYRMKSGGNRWRTYHVSRSTDPALLDRVLGSQEYKEGFFNVYNDEYLEPVKDKLTFCYSDQLRSSRTAVLDYDTFREAYRKDLEQYDFSYLLRHPMTGSLSIQTRQGTFADSDYTSRYIMEYNIYEGFENTISFLKDNNLYLEPIGPSRTEQIRITFLDARPNEDYNYEALPVVVYTDPEQIEEIMKNAVSRAWYGPFCNLIPFDSSYDVTAYTTETDRLEGITFSFREGAVPAFVQEDFAAYQ